MSRGSIIKRGSTYSIVLYLGRGPDGRRVRRWHSGYRTKKDAERARTELLASVDQGAYVEPSRLTLAAFLHQQWLPGLAGRVRATTLHSYRTNLERYALPRIGQVMLQRLTPAHLNALCGALRVAVRQTLVLAGRQVVTSEPKTSRGRRSIALDPRTVGQLRTWRATQLEERLAWGPSYSDSGLVFTREDGTRLHPEWLSDAFAWRIRTAGLPPIRFHDLRHTHASLGLAAGVPIKVMSERLGHSTSSFTADAYQHVTPTLEEQAAATVARLVFGS